MTKVEMLLYGALGLFVFFSKAKKAAGGFSHGSSREKSRRTEELLAGLSAKDPSVDPERLKARATSVFMKLQECWEARDYGPMRPLMSDYLYETHCRKVEAMREAHEINRLENLLVLGVDLVHARYTAEPSGREFTALISAQARDYYIDDRDRSFLRGDSSAQSFSEFWVFQLQGGAWVLSRIDQLGENPAVHLEDVCETQAAPAPAPQAAGSAGPAQAPFQPNASIPPLPLIPPVGRDSRVLPPAPVTPPPSPAVPETAGLAPAPAARVPVPGRGRVGAELAASAIFLCAYSAWEKGDPAALPEADLLPAMREAIAGMMARCRAQGLSFAFEGLAVTRAEVVLAEGAPGDPGEQFAARITARARKALRRNGETVHQEAHPVPFTECWLFARDGGRWKAKELLPRAGGKRVLLMDDEETDSTPVQMEWHCLQGAGA